MITDDHVRHQINAAIATSKSRDIAFVAHFRHHWLVLRFSIHDGTPARQIRVYDSAPSPMVARDLERMALRFAWPLPRFVPCPRQVRGSQECGIFALLNALLLERGVEPPNQTTELSLNPLRVLLMEAASITEPAEQTRRRFLESGLTLYDKLRGAPHGGEGQFTCTATTQAKRGGKQCGNPARDIGGRKLCKMHALLAETDKSRTCTALTNARRPCSHGCVKDLQKCAFHTTDTEFEEWINRRAAQEQPTPDLPANEEGSPVAAETQDSHNPSNRGEAAAAPSMGEEEPHQPPVDDNVVDLQTLLEILDDPDFEDEMLQFATFDPAGAHRRGPATTRPEANPLETDWTPPPQASTNQVKPITLGQLNSLLASSRGSAHPLALAHIQEATAGYLRCLRNLRLPDAVPLENSPIVPAILELFNRRRRARGWRWTSMLRNLCEVQGAFKNLPLLHGIAAIELNGNPEWSAALKHAAAAARSERPRVPKAITFAQVCEAIRQEPRRPVKLLIAMTWLCTGRTGDCRQLDPRDVVSVASRSQGDALDGAVAGIRLTVTFRQGKTVKRRGPYSLHTQMNAELVQLLEVQPGTTEWVATLKRASVKDVLVALRRVDPSLENRSVRRGALQALANAGVDEETLLLFSGHATLAMLRRYLNWGSIGTEKATRMAAAAEALNSTTPVAQHQAVRASGGEGDTQIRQHNPYALKVIYSTQTDNSHSIGRLNQSAFNGLSPERWLAFLGTEAPPVEELPGFNVKWDINLLPMASKDVAATADIQALRSMASDPELLQLADLNFAWLHDTHRYEELSKSESNRRGRSRARCFLPAEDVEKQIQLGKYETKLRRLSNKEVKMWCRVFTVPEISKRRRRHICEPLINDKFTATPTIKFTTKEERKTIIKQFLNGWAVTLDYTSCFDQFGLHENVRPYFGIRLPDGSVTRMAVLPMGFRPAAAIAQTATWCVCDLGDVKEHGTGKMLRYGVDYVVLSYIDNILILAKEKETARQVTTMIVERSAAAGLQFNEYSPDPTQQFEFLGEEFDLQEGTVRQAAKTAAKVNLINPEVFEAPTGCTMTRRQLAAVIGLFLFASGCCDVLRRRHQYFYALRFYQNQVQWRDGKQPAWDSPIDAMPPAVAANFKQWTAELQENPQLKLVLDGSSQTPTDLMFVDASEERWSAVHLCGNHLRVYAEDWTPADRKQWNLASSVASEPLGIRKALCRAITPSSQSHIAIFTDHEPIVSAAQAPCARCYSYWQLQCFLAEFPARVVIHHIPGVKNPADLFTRGSIAESATALSRQQEDQHEWFTILDNAVSFANNHRVDDNGEDGISCRKEWSQTARNPLRILTGRDTWG